MKHKGLIFIVVLLGVGGVLFLFQPICVPIFPESIPDQASDLAQRSDTDFYLKVFQQKDGQWYQCKTRLSRMLFF